MNTVEKVKVAEFGVTKSKLQQAKEAFNRHKAKVVAGAVAGGTAVYSTSASANTDLTAVTSSVSTQMDAIAGAGMVIIGAIAGAAITLFAGVFVWKYGKKIFSVISR